ncbi:unnamed protein product [Schistosoma turkestanicum]|nr:unnamed protein product [Schistosoma turkestanicum]
MSTNMNSVEEWTRFGSNNTQIDYNNELPLNINHVMRQLSRKMCKQYLLLDDCNEMKSVKELGESLNIVSSRSNTVLYAKFKSDNQSGNHDKLKQSHTKNGYKVLDDFGRYQYKDFGYGISEINGENLEYILNDRHRKSPDNQVYDNIFPKNKLTYRRNGKKFASTQVVDQRKYCKTPKSYSSSTCSCSSNCGKKFNGALTTRHPEIDLNKLIQQPRNDDDHNTSIINNVKTTGFSRSTTPFSWIEFPVLTNVFTNLLSNQKDSACESDNGSSLNDELHPLKNPLEFLKSSSYQSLPKIINDSAYTSVMWKSLVKLLNQLISEERLFWHEKLLNRNKFNNLEVDTIDVKSLLSDIDRFYSEEFRLLWKQIYESWVPRDYLQYFSDETRKVFINLNLVIQKLLLFIEKGNCDISSLHSEISFNHEEDNLENFDGFKSFPKKCFTNQQQQQQHNNNYHSMNNDEQSLNNGRLFNSQHLETNENRISFKQMRELLKLSHQQLLEQIYHVTEMVGAALDTDMEDAINGVHISAVTNHKHINDDIQTSHIGNNNNFTPSDLLTNPSTPGLQVVAKLLSAILDLETRLDTICVNQIIAENITNSDITFDSDQCAANDLKHTSGSSSPGPNSSSVKQEFNSFQMEDFQNPHCMNVNDNRSENERYKIECLRSSSGDDDEGDNFTNGKPCDLNDELGYFDGM